MRGKTHLLLVLGAMSAPASGNWVRWDQNGHYYAAQRVVDPAGIRWTDANDVATARGAYLACITSPEENAFVFSLVNSPSYFQPESGSSALLGPWIGAWRPDTTFQWVSGEPFAYAPWSPGEPNDHGGEENYVQFFGYGTPAPLWNDFPNDGSTLPGHERPTAYVLEREACPADLNNDGLRDFFDVQAFLQAFSSGLPAADFTHDGALDFFDVQAFLNLYSGGCP